jgi:hypothetical protein
MAFVYAWVRLTEIRYSLRGLYIEYFSGKDGHSHLPGGTANKTGDRHRTPECSSALGDYQWKYIKTYLLKNPMGYGYKTMQFAV